jgi:hypothetical protein
MTRAELLDKIDMLNKQREQVMINANNTLGEIAGRIAVCQEWLATLPDDPPPPPPPPSGGTNEQLP